LQEGDLPLTDASNRSPSYTIILRAYNESVSFDLEYALSYSVGADGWAVSGISLSRSHATPLDTIPQREIDAFIANLRAAEGYDSISLVNRNTDLSRNFDELVFSASRQHPLARETSDVIASVTFDERQGQWQIRTPVMDASSFEWDILGSWSGVREGAAQGQGAANYALNITEFDGASARVSGEINWRRAWILRDGTRGLGATTVPDQESFNDVFPVDRIMEGGLESLTIRIPLCEEVSVTITISVNDVAASGTSVFRVGGGARGAPASVELHRS
jgi:hypothetical protein